MPILLSDDESSEFEPNSESSELSESNSESNTTRHNTRSKRKLDRSEDSDFNSDDSNGSNKRKKYVARDVVPGMPKHHQRVEMILLTDVYENGVFPMLDTSKFEIYSILIKHRKELLKHDPNRKFCDVICFNNEADESFPGEVNVYTHIGDMNDYSYQPDSIIAIWIDSTGGVEMGTSATRGGTKFTRANEILLTLIKQDAFKSIATVMINFQENKKISKTKAYIPFETYPEYPMTIANQNGYITSVADEIITDTVDAEFVKTDPTHYNIRSNGRDVVAYYKYKQMGSANMMCVFFKMYKQIPCNV